MVIDEKVKTDVNYKGKVETADTAETPKPDDTPKPAETNDTIGSIADGIAYKEEFTTTEAAILCGLSTMRAKQYARSRNLPRFGKAYRWTREDVEDMRSRKLKRD